MRTALETVASLSETIVIVIERKPTNSIGHLVDCIETARCETSNDFRLTIFHDLLDDTFLP